MYQNYIFDLYGTLVDIHTNEESASFWKKIARLFALQGAFYMPAEAKARYGELVKEEEQLLSASTGIPANEVEILVERVFERMFSEKGVTPSKEQLYYFGVSFRNESLVRLRMFPGAKSLLQRLKKAGKGVYLLSNAQRVFTEPEMRLLGIYDLFDGIIYSSDVGVKKPSPRFFTKIIEKYKLEKDSCVMIGNDSKADIGGAHNFGMDSMYVHTEQSSPLTGDLPADCRRLARIGEAF